MQNTTWICRILFGCTFIFSGFVKAIDPWGTFYKFTEYLSVMGLNLIPNLILTGVFGLCAIEFLIGVCILTGSYRKSAPIAALLIMGVMLPLTLWIAISDPVADCGCFGDALKISNWATFWKNVVLTLAAVWLLKHNKSSYALITPALQWISIVAGILYIGVIMICGYFTQPLIDYRPYPIGEKFIADEEGEDPQYVFVYKRNGEKKEFGEEDELPDEEEGWEFVERREVTPETEESAKGMHKTFRIWDEQGDHDMTETVITDEGKMLLLLIPDLSTVSPAITWKINSLYDQATDHGMDMIAAVSGNSSLIREWADLSMPQYEIFIAEDTSIKEVARGNPAIVYLEDGIVKWKTTLSSLEIDNFGKPERMKELSSVLTDGHKTVLKLTTPYICILALLMAFSMLPYIRRAYRKKTGEQPDATDDDRARHEE